MSKTTIYKMPGKTVIWKNGYTVKTVGSEEVEGYLSDGWHESPLEAKKAFDEKNGKAVNAMPEPEPEAEGLGSKTREELEAIAEAMEDDNKGLNIAFNSRTDDNTLRARILAAKAELEKAD